MSKRGPHKLLRSIHEELIDSLEARLSSNYVVIRNREYKNGNNGEIDLIAITNNYLLIFEVKSTSKRKNKKKAKQQLTRAKAYTKRRFSRNYKIVLFEVYGSKTGYEIHRYST